MAASSDSGADGERARLVPVVDSVVLSSTAGVSASAAGVSGTGVVSKGVAVAVAVGLQCQFL